MQRILKVCIPYVDGMTICQIKFFSYFQHKFTFLSMTDCLFNPMYSFTLHFYRLLIYKQKIFLKEKIQDLIPLAVRLNKQPHIFNLCRALTVTSCLRSNFGNFSTGLGSPSCPRSLVISASIRESSVSYNPDTRSLTAATFSGSTFLEQFQDILDFVFLLLD